MSRPENQLEVDQSELVREAESVALPDSAAPPGADQPPPPVAAAAGEAPPGPPPASWSTVTPGLVSAIDLAVCPNWELTRDERAELSEALAPALDQLFPGGIGDERWAPYFRLIAVAVAIAATRFDREALRFKPLHKSKPKKSAEQGAAAEAPAGGGSFVAAPGAGP